MAVSIVNYVGNGSLRSFGITFSYLSRNDVRVYLDNVLQSTPEHYTFLNDSTIQFVDAPVANSAIKIQRVSDSSDRLVDYQNGAVLTEAELDIDSKQAFYLVQETKESFQDLLDTALVRIAAANGVVGVPPEQIIDEMVQTALDDALLVELQNRVTDIDDNASAVIQQALNINTEITNRSLADVNLQTQINALSQAIAASSVYVQTTAPVPGVGGVPNPIPANARWYDSDDNNHPYIWDDVGLVWISLLDPRIGQNAADITALEVSMTTAQADILTNAGSITTNANAISVLDTTVTAINGTISTISSDVTNLQASMTTAQGDILTNAGGIAANAASITANAGAITVLQSRVTATENSITVNASDITSLTASLALTDANVLANTNGLVTANASITANAGAITTLQSRVTATENSITVNSSDITALTASLAITDGNVLTNTNNVLTNTNNIATNTADIVTANASISANASAVTTLQSRVTVTENDIATNSTDITNLTATVDLKARTFVQTTAPTATATGDIWYDSDDGYRKYRWNGTAWVDIMDTIKTQTFAQTTPPTAKQVGDLWFDTDDGNRLYRWSGSAWVDYQDTNHASATALSLLDARVVVTESGVSSNASSITTLNSTVSSHDGRLDSAEVTIAAHTTSISTAEGDILTLEAKYGVQLDVNGYVTGFAQNNDGDSGSFAILADFFQVATPSTQWAATTAYSLGDMVRPTTPTSPARVFKCTTAGTSGGSEPTWNTTLSGTTADNTVTWTTFDDTALIPFQVSGSEIILNTNVTVSGNLISGGTIEAVRFQTASGTTQKIVIDEATNELQFFGDRGDTTIEELATLGGALGGNDTILDIGTANSDLTALNIRGNCVTPLSLMVATCLGSGDTANFIAFGSGRNIVATGSDDEDNMFMQGPRDVADKAAIHIAMPGQTTPAECIGMRIRFIDPTDTGQVHLRLERFTTSGVPDSARGDSGDILTYGDHALYYKDDVGWSNVSRHGAHYLPKGAGTINLLKEESGSFIVFTSSSYTKLILPAAAPGLYYRVALGHGAYSTSNTHRVTTTGANIIYHPNDNAAYDTVRWDTSENRNSMVEFLCDGTYWYANTAAGVTFFNDI